MNKKYNLRTKQFVYVYHVYDYCIFAFEIQLSSKKNDESFSLCFNDMTTFNNLKTYLLSALKHLVGCR